LPKSQPAPAAVAAKLSDGGFLASETEECFISLNKRYRRLVASIAAGLSYFAFTIVTSSNNVTLSALVHSPPFRHR